MWDVDGNEYIEYGSGLRVGQPRARPPAGGRGGAPRARPRQQLRAAERDRGRGGGAVPGHRPHRRDGEVREERLGRHHRRRAPRPRRHRPHHGGHLPRPAVLLHRRLVHRRHADVRRHPRPEPSCPSPTATSAATAALLDAARRPDRLPDPRGRHPAPSRRPATWPGVRELADPARRRTRPRRDDHRLPLVRGGRAGRLRRRRRTCRRSARRWATASPSPRWPARAS